MMKKLFNWLVCHTSKTNYIVKSNGTLTMNPFVAKEKSPTPRSGDHNKKNRIFNQWTVGLTGCTYACENEERISNFFSFSFK